MRRSLVLYVNGQRHEVAGAEVFTSLSSFLRLRLGLTGTKIVCSEGDCGSCTVLVGRMEDGALRYQSIDSCIQLLFQLDAAHVVTVEGLADSSRSLTTVQQAMVDCHGSQCGFCTPGFVMAMTAVLEERSPPSAEDWKVGLTGNLCRCTGYQPILDAGRCAADQPYLALGERFASEDMLAELRQLSSSTLLIEAQDHDRRRCVFSPTTLDEALAFLKKNPDATILAGATDLGVQLNKRKIDPGVFLDLNRIDELAALSCDDRQIVCGPRVTWSDLEPVCAQRIPELYEVIKVFGSPQIRNVGTLGGNIANASPIADSLPFLLVVEAELELRSAELTRRIGIDQFYLGYKQLDLNRGEMITGIRIPLPLQNQRLGLIKVSRRRDLDIATFAGAVLIGLEGNRIATARVAVGGCAPTVIRLAATEDFLSEKSFSEETMRAAGDIAVGEIAPLTDVRGSAEYRRQLTRNFLLRFYHQQQQPAAT